jgi:hypothetical protein
MNHNKYNFKVGDKCIVDANYANPNEVEILAFTPNQMFVTIKIVDEPDANKWETMTRRLTPIK